MEMYNEINDVSTNATGVFLSFVLKKGNLKTCLKGKKCHFLIPYLLDLNTRIFSNVLYFLIPICKN